ncbi:nuclease-related domain-containing protein [Periweissella fabalis]|uniref:NERD domain-containing protein n=1 Tax=Periweissella fabalis TaxID=1070421 RepID=A0A7X6N2Y4_9LACO|nr:nuclease-related domain-containing protein [Periweissella fabalis]MCM0598699.1 NERD domain-containing protein [Periweissella fabalis]NKZ24352.1 hypothetical protein [Periweissella fabalis]
MEFHGKVREIVPYDHRRHTGGYGFIQSEDNQSIFFLLSWANYQPVQVGDLVEFETEYDENQRLHANPVARDESKLVKNLKQCLEQGGYKSSRKKLPVPGVTAINTNMTAAYEALNAMQNKFGIDNDVQPASMLSTINEWISLTVELSNKFEDETTLQSMLIKRNILPKRKQLEELQNLQVMIRKMNYEQRGRYYGVRGEQIVQAKLEQHHLQYIKNPTLPEFDTNGNVVGATEIDFIVISMFGIHVLEVKNYGANKNQDQRLTISKDGQWNRIGATQENVTNQNDLHIAAVEGVLFDAPELKKINPVKLLATPVFVIPNENVEIVNHSAEYVVRTGLLYDTLVQDVRRARQAVLEKAEIEKVMTVLKSALEENREFQYFLPNSEFLTDAYELKRRYNIAQYIYDQRESIYQ